MAIGPLRVPNRFIVQPMEGFDSLAGGAPGELSFRRYRRFAEGGSGLLWFEATAILHEARSNPHQLCLDRAMKAEGAVAREHRHGIFGGLTPAERATLAQDHPKEAA